MYGLKDIGKKKKNCDLRINAGPKELQDHLVEVLNFREKKKQPKVKSL